MNSQLTHQDWEALSAYLDGQLNSREQYRLETRLETNPTLRAALDELSKTRQILRSTPRLQTPRSFTLSPEMAGVESHRSLAFPFFRIAFALASVLFVFVFVGDVVGVFPSGVTLTAEAPAIAMQERVVEQERVMEDVTQESEAPLEITPQPEMAAAPAEEAIEEQEDGDEPADTNSFRPSGTQPLFMQADETVTTQTEVVKTEVTEAEEMETTVEPTAVAMEPEVEGAEDLTGEKIQEAAPPPRSILSNPFRLLEIIFASAAVLSGLGMLITRRRMRR